MNVIGRTVVRCFLLCVCLAPAAHGQSASSASAKGSLRIRSAGRSTVLSPADLAKIAHHDLRVAAESSSDSATVSGVTLWDVLRKAGIPSAEASGRQRAAMYVRLRGADGQNAVFALVELDPGFSRREVLVADHRNGQALDPAEGPWRVFAPDDLRHARWIRGLVEIDVETLKP